MIEMLNQKDRLAPPRQSFLSRQTKQLCSSVNNCRPSMKEIQVFQLNGFTGPLITVSFCKENTMNSLRPAVSAELPSEPCENTRKEKV
jgi:hypothetical protein